MNVFRTAAHAASTLFKKGASAAVSVANNNPALGAELSGLRDRVRNDTARTVQRVGAGAVDSVVQEIATPGSPRSQPVTLPLTTSQLAIGGAILLGVIGIAFAIGRRS